MTANDRTGLTLSAWTTYWHPLKAEDGSILGINVAAEEITEQKRAEAALQLANESLEARTVELTSSLEELRETQIASFKPKSSQALARHRATVVAGVSYDLSLDVTSLDSAVGRVTIGFRRVGPDDAILDFRGRRLVAVLANGDTVPSADARNGHLVVPARLLRVGENTIRLEFVSDIAPSGASIIRNHDPTDGSDYLYTLLVPADASQLFPCFDQPDLKARVRLSLTAPADWSVVSNGRIVASHRAGAATTTSFSETRPISTYLIAFAAGPWRAAHLESGGRTITAYVRRSRAAEADLDTMLALNARALDWMERYFGRRYPFEKFDFVLAPAFPFGGMEHPGAVFYSEDGFIFRERPTLPRRLGRYSTILHEVAHQWFGDLVTMRWFDDLWLKEGFATFMAAKALADLEPTADAWKTFYLGNKPPAYAVDRTAGTRPLWQPLDNLDQAKSNYGAIVYNKAPAVLRQLEYLVGDSAFQAGVRRFLGRYAYGNAGWRDLVGAIGTAAGRPLDGFGRQFMLRAGMPVLEQRLELRDGRIVRLALAQSPAVSACELRRVGTSANAACHPEAEAAPTWTERTQVLLHYPDRPAVRLPVELRGAVTEIHAAVGRPGPRLRLRQRPRLRVLPPGARLDQRPDARAGRARSSGRRFPARDALGRDVGPGPELPHGPGAVRPAGAS